MAESLIICAASCAAMVSCVLYKPQIHIKKLYIDTYWVVALIGAVVMLAVGMTDFKHLIPQLLSDSAVNPVKILVLFISMTLLSVFLDELGFFEYLACRALSAAGGSQKRLFFTLYLTVSVLTVFTSNDIIILTFTPFICCFSSRAGIDPVPYLFAEFIAANTWSMVLIIGNPTNIYLAGVCGIDFLTYTGYMLLPTVAAGLATLTILTLLFKKKLKLPVTPTQTEAVIKDKPMLIIGLSALIVCTLLLALGSYIGIEMWAVSLISAVCLFTAVLILGAIRRKAPRELADSLKRAPWQLVPFILSMFVMILALSEHGVTDKICSLLGESGTVLKYGISSFLCSNVINNIPMSVLFGEVTSALSGQTALRAVLACVIGSNLGAFLTPVGALAGIMWASILKKHGVKFSVLTFVKYGAAVSVPALLAALGVLYLELL